MNIWKYVMKKRDFTVEMPKGAEILSCRIQGELPVIWALVEEDASKEERHFVGISTGERVNYRKSQLRFIDTVQTPDTGMVQHIFEVLS